MPDTFMTAENKVPRDEAQRLFARGMIERARGGDGYDVMGAVAKGESPWTAVDSWGEDGWNLGDWPYVVIYVRHAEKFELAYYVEGDIDIWRFPDKESLYQAIDELAFFHWNSRERSREWLKGAEDWTEMPARMRGSVRNGKESGMKAVVESLDADSGVVALEDAESGRTWKLLVTAPRPAGHQPGQAEDVAVRVIDRTKGAAWAKVEMP